MDQTLRFDSENLNIEELLKTSKHFQNKMRQELTRQNLKPPADACEEQEELPPVWDQAMMSSYLKNVVADHFNHRQSLNEESSDVPIMAKVSSPSPVKKPTKKAVGLQVNESLLGSHRVLATVATQVEHNKFKEVKNQAPIAVNKSISPHKPIVSQRSVLKKSHLKASESYLNSNKSLSKQSMSTQRLPLQRFADTHKTDIDFNKEHPSLGLDMSPGQSTLFPRRFVKQSEPKMPLSLTQSSVNLAEAEIKKPDVALVEKRQETWNGILLKNRSETKTPTKVVRLKQPAPVHNSKEKPKTTVKQPKDIEIISNQVNCLYMLEKQSGKLNKHKKCNLQRFPVMYIRPECQVQRVVQISIGGDNRTLADENLSKNAKYVECKHSEDKQMEPKAPPTCPKEEEANENKYTELHSRNENKFYKALEFSCLPVSQSSNSRSSESEWVSSSSSSRSVLKHANAVTSCNEINRIKEQVIASPEKVLPSISKNFIRTPPSRREVYVQTDHEFKPNPATATTTPPELTSTIIIDTLSTQPLPPTPPPPPIAVPQKTHKEDTSIEEDFIAKIFERIRNDVPSAVQAFKNLNNTKTTTITTPTISLPVVEQFQKQIHKHHHQMSAISDSSNVELLPNEIEPRLARVEAKGQENSETILQMAPAVDVVRDTPLGSGSEDEESLLEGNLNFVLLQQNPLFVQTINRIKSSAIDDAMPGKRDDRIKKNRHEYPTDAEIKRAVKIFIDSLTLDGSDGNRGGGGGGNVGVGFDVWRKSISNDDSVRKKMKSLPRLELINSGRLCEYMISDSSKISYSLSRSNSSSSISSGGTYVKRESDLLRGCGVSESSSFTPPSSSSDADSESEETKDMPRLPLNESNDNSLSDGEVLSVGEPNLKDVYKLFRTMQAPFQMLRKSFERAKATDTRRSLVSSIKVIKTKEFKRTIPEEEP